MVYQDPAILQELQQEAESWKRTLEFIRDENIQLKTRLSEIIRQNHADQQFLDTAEYYNARFLSEDEMLRLLRRDISELDRMLMKHIVENDQEMSGICNRHELHYIYIYYIKYILYYIYYICPLGDWPPGCLPPKVLSL